VTGTTTSWKPVHGVFVVIVAVTVVVWAIAELRQTVRTVRTSSDQPVIAEGPYRYLRHPSYLGLLLAVTGIGFLIGNWLSLLALTVGVAVGLVYRIRVEEIALLGELGDRYRDYAATRKRLRLIPYVW
jgi:protein-S-isoprenylcysteine O-methyltransferase Ste14